MLLAQTIGGFTLIYLLLVVSLLAFLIYQAYFWIKRKQSASMIDQADFQATMHQAQIIDVRAAQEFRSSHILGARNIPYSEVRQLKKAPGLNRSQKIYLYDNGVNIATRMASVLKQEGYEDIYILKGGFNEWEGKTKGTAD